MTEPSRIDPRPTFLHRSDSLKEWGGYPVIFSRCAAEGYWEGEPFANHWVSVITKGTNITKIRAGQSTREILFTPGTGSSYPMGQHWDHLRFSGEVESIYVSLDSEFLGDRKEMIRNHRIHGSHACFRDDSVEAICNSLVREIINNGQSGPLYAESLSIALMARIAAIDPVARDSRSSNRLPPRLAIAIEQYIREKLDTSLSIAELAAECSMGRSHFASCFKDTFGCSVHRYITSLRIERAKNLLSQGQDIAQVGLICGFSNQSHFTEVFRKIVGQTPAIYRRDHWPRVFIMSRPGTDLSAQNGTV